MSLRIVESGLQSTIQAAPRVGLRHQGVPTSGAADPLSLALANRLLGNPLLSPALELSLSGIRFRIAAPVSFAVTGAPADCTLSGQPFEQHTVVHANVDDEVVVGAAQQGARSYVAFRGGLVADHFLGSDSTYLPAAFGGHAGRALAKDDVVSLRSPGRAAEKQTPTEFRLPLHAAWTLRAGHSAETSLLEDPELLFNVSFVVSHRGDRMGVGLDDTPLSLQSDGRMPSSAVFPGIVQCPEDGRPFLLGVDAQTTGGYPRVAKVARLDMHLLGQLRPGDTLRFLFRDDATAAHELQEKRGYWGRWLDDLTHII